MYLCYLGEDELPTPAKLTVKIKNQNKTLTLLNEGEINFLRAAGLTEITLPLTLSMLGGSRTPDYYLGLLEKLKTEKTPVQFILVREAPDGGALYDTNMKVSVEDYTTTEDAKNGLDVSVEVKLKQWRDYGTKTVVIEENKDGEKTATTQEERDDSSAPKAKTYTVKKGDTLWALAAKYYGSGAQYKKIFDANKDKISNPNLIYPGQVFTIP